MWLQAGIFSDAPRPSWGRWALFHFPFQLHAAWATAALVVNVNIVLVADAARAARGDLALFAAVLSLVRRPIPTRASPQQSAPVSFHLGPCECPSGRAGPGRAVAPRRPQPPSPNGSPPTPPPTHQTR